MSRNLRRDAYETAGTSFSQGSSFGTTSFFKKQRRFYEENPFDGLCSTAPCVWLVVFMLWATSVVTVSMSWNLDFFRPLMFSSPVLITLLFTLCSSTCKVPGEPSPRKLTSLGLLMFAVYWTVYKAYPTQCRSAWGFKMVSDTSFIGNQTAVNMQVLKHMQKIYVSSEDDEADESILPLLDRATATVNELKRRVRRAVVGSTGSNKSNATEVQTNKSNASAHTEELSPAVAAMALGATAMGTPDLQQEAASDPAESEAEVAARAANVFDALRGALPVSNGLGGDTFDALKSAQSEWLTPWTNGDTFENFVLRAYCDMHRSDHELPHVYPLLKLGISPMEFPWKVPCPYGSCILTEPRSLSAGKLVFLWMLVVPAAVHLLHARLTGQCYPWWQWFWACLLPLWLVAFIESIHDVELSELIAGFVRTIVELPNLFKGEMGETDYERVGYLVLSVVAAVLAYYFRDRIRAEFGLHEWLPFLFAGRRSAGEHTFQVCVWKVDSRTHAELDEEEEEPAAGGVVARGMQAMGIPTFSGVGPLRAKGYKALFGQGGTVLPESISVRLCYGGEELQRTRSQQAGSGGMFSDVYLFQENFTLSLERRPGTVFTVEVQGKTSQGADFSSAVNFVADRLDRAFQRSSEAACKPGYVMDQRIADTQVVRMRSSRVDERVMTNLGFHHYPGSSGGEIWLAFCDMEEEEAASNWPAF